MKLTIERADLINPLQLITGVVDRRQSLPILGNLLLNLENKELTIVGTDLGIELQARILLEKPIKEGVITVPAHKLMDVCRALPDAAVLDIEGNNQKLLINSNRTRFNLAALPAESFPRSETFSAQLQVKIPQQELLPLILNTSFSMAEQDVRYYLNGMLLEVKADTLFSVATDGHRMATSRIQVSGNEKNKQVIIPYKSVQELARLLSTVAGEVTLSFGDNLLRVDVENYTFTTKLIDGQFPRYENSIQNYGDKILIADRDALKQALTRVATLASGKHRPVRLELRAGLLKITANNTEQEEAEEECAVGYNGEDLDIGFNVNYLLDVLSVLPAGDVKMFFSTPDQSAYIEAADASNNSVYVIMPMRL